MTSLAGSPLQAFVAQAATRPEPPEAWMRALVRAYVDVHALALDVGDLALFRSAAPASDAVQLGREVTAALASIASDDGPDVLGQAHELLVERGHRRRRGVFYTPPDVAASLVALVLPDADGVETPLLPRVLDPACGGGAFLLAAARRLEARGHTRRTIVERALWGVDIDPLAAAVTEAVLRCWAVSDDGGGQDRVPDEAPRDLQVQVADALRCAPGSFTGAGDGFDAVVGNPPFLSQLGSATARPTGSSGALAPALAAAAYRYADTATVFLAAACRLARPGGRIGLILPQSFLVADDAAAVRASTLDLADLEHLWVALEPVFAAGVRVCAPVVRVRHEQEEGCGAAAARRPVQRWRGRSFAAAGTVPMQPGCRAGAPWAPLIADLFGVPPVTLRTGGATLASLCEATAGFRDQYYGIVPATREASSEERALVASDDGGRRTTVMPLLTCGLVDPVWSQWGRQPTRFAKQVWQAPVVDLDALAHDPALQAWALARRVPKIILATQTRVIEGIVDETGACYPSVPAIALRAEPDRLWDAAAVVLSPVVTLWAFRRHAGAALSSDALKVSARQILDAPLPDDTDAWVESTTHLRVAHAAAAGGDRDAWRTALGRFAAASVRAYGLDPEEGAALTEWWSGRLPRRGDTVSPVVAGSASATTTPTTTTTTTTTPTTTPSLRST